MSRLRATLTLLLTPILLPAVLAAQNEPDGTLKLVTYLDWETVSNPQISPDGSEIIFTKGWVDKINDRRSSSIYIMNADGSRMRVLVEDGSSPKWSPSGDRILYTAGTESEGTEIFVRWMDDEGAASQITHLENSPGNVEWSPDGTQIAFTMSVDSDHPWPISLPGRPDGANWTAGPKVVDRLVYRRDRRGYIDGGYSHLFVVPADGGTARQLTDGDWNHNGVAWTPDGAEILFTSLRVEDAEHEWRQSDIYSVSIASGDITRLTDRSGPDGSPLPSPDGRLIAFTGNDLTTDTYITPKLYVMNRDGSNVRMISDGFDRRGSGMIWADDGSGFYMTVRTEGTSNLYFASVRGGVRPVTEGNHMLSVSTIGSGMAVGTLSDYHRPGDLVSFPLTDPGRISQLTDVNADVLHGVALGEVEEVWYKSVEDYDIQGWIIKPPDFDPSKKYPLILAIHGGPHGMYHVGFNFGWQNHAANGYVVLYTNPRGSSGYGSAFGNAIKNAYPGKDFDDLMAGVDLVVERGYIDEQNMFVYGCSGGRRADFVGRGTHGPVRGGVGQLPGNELALLRRHDRRRQLVPQLRALPLGRPVRAPAPLPAHVRRQRHHPHHAHDRRGRPAHPDAPDRGVLPGAARAEGPDRDDPLQERVARHEFNAVELPADADLPEGVVREASERGAGYVGRA